MLIRNYYSMCNAPMGDDGGTGGGQGTVVIDGDTSFKTHIPGSNDNDDGNGDAGNGGDGGDAGNNGNGNPNGNNNGGDGSNNTGGSILTIESNGVTTNYTLDDKGNATLNGQIVYTAEQIAEFERESNPDGNLGGNQGDENIHQLISQTSGIELLDANGSPIEFKPGLEGLAEREILVKNTFYNQGKDAALRELFTNEPDLFDMYSYKRKHGSLDNYTRKVDYSTLEIKEDTTTDILKSIIKDHLIALGNDEDTANRLIRLSENEETLRVDAVKSLNKLREIQVAQAETEVAQQRQREADAIKEIENYYGVSYDNKNQMIDKKIEGSVYDKIVNKGIIGNIMLPKEGIITEQDGKKVRITRNQLFDYFYQPIKQNDGTYLSKAQIDENKRISNMDNFLIQGIKNISGNDLSSLEKVMKNVIRIKDAKTIIKRINSGSNGNGSGSGKSLDEQLQTGSAKVIIN